MVRFLSGRMALIAALLAVSATPGRAADAPGAPGLTHTRAITCAALGVLHTSLTDKGYKITEGIDYAPRAKYWLEHAINVRPSDWTEQRVVDEFKALNTQTSQFMSGLFERYQNDKTPENMQAIVAALQAMKQDLAACDAYYPDQ
jgi:hypothetical protein